MKRWKCWVTGLWLTNRTQKAGWQWRTLADRHPSLRWGDAELSLHIHTQLQLRCESSLLRLFSIPSQLCHSPTLSFVIILSCTVRLWRPDRRTRCWWEWTGLLQKLLRWQLSLSCPLFSQKLQTTQMHIQCSPPYIPGSDWFFFLILLFWSASMVHSDAILDLSLESLFCTYCTVSALWMPRWPLQGDKLSESKLHHEQKIEHATFSEKSNTNSHPQYKRTEPKA